MKLYYSPGACSLASHIALFGAGVKFEAEQVDTKAKKTKSGKDFSKINSKGYVPCLETKEGVLTEGCAILQYIADQAPEKNLLPKNGTWERYRAQEWLNFIATEIHKNFSPLWNKDLPEATKKAAIERLTARVQWLAGQIKPGQYLLGSQFSVCDAYLFTVLNWSRSVKFDLTQWPALMGYLEKVTNLPATQSALKAEGLSK